MEWQSKYGKMNDSEHYSKGKMSNSSRGRVMKEKKTSLSSKSVSRPAGRTSWVGGYKTAGTDAC